MSDNPPGGTVVDEAVNRTLKWADAMQEWLVEYESHINDLVTERQIPKPPRW